MGIRSVDMLVLDECHDSLDQLCEYLGVMVDRKTCLSIGVTRPISGFHQGQWSATASTRRTVLSMRNSGWHKESTG